MSASLRVLVKNEIHVTLYAVGWVGTWTKCDGCMYHSVMCKVSPHYNVL